ncbi:histone deacetylase 6-like isoform X2 [Amphiura filiformis]|uniref:histone deacetylase 6-like isoform X2 n=1 Tax=Amphiura filiformis TaxID=82378 RepID=UPI003B214321
MPTIIVVCHDRMKELNLIDRCVSIPIRSATDEEILSCHGPDYLQLLKDTQTMTLPQLKEHMEPDDEGGVSFSNATYECACLALGGALELTERVVRGELRNGIAVIRPPGHHAQKCCGNGYCYFNNAAIAAQIARTKWNVQRVMIVDWDVHHGQGVQYMFEDDPSVLYFSTHRYDRKNFWPYLTESNWDHIGKGEGCGFNINVPWNHRDHGNAEYLAAFQQVLLPIAYEFNPDLVLVSSGIDAGLSDPQGEMSIHPGFYAHLTHMLMGLANGKVVVLLEGGYSMKGLAEGISMCTKALLGDPCPPYEDLGKPYDCAVETILEVIAHHKPYWQCLEYQVPSKSPEQCDEVSSTTEASLESDEQDAETNKLLEEMTPEETLLACKKLDELISQTSQLHVAPHRTCLAYDERMQKHKPPFGLVNNSHISNELQKFIKLTNEHPERPERISHIFERHKKWGLVDRCLNVQPRMATDEEIALCHDPQYIEETKDYANFSPRELLSFQDKYSSIYLHQSTHDCARLALGCTLQVVDTVLSGKARNGVAIVRPPGHHAEYHTAMGFCFFNHIAIAAEHAKKNYGLQRILILDWDIHHGNGTQHMFEDKKDVLYISLHRYDGGFFFPGGLDGMADKVGLGEGEGYNVNIAWNGRSMGMLSTLQRFSRLSCL